MLKDLLGTEELHIMLGNVVVRTVLILIKKKGDLSICNIQPFLMFSLHPVFHIFFANSRCTCLSLTICDFLIARIISKKNLKTEKNAVILIALCLLEFVIPHGLGKLYRYSLTAVAQDKHTMKYH